ncbi:MAG: aminotransferase class III-fold pyridoxal phosphate-dependent enzyme, partial [Pseudomonas sp.]
ARGKQMLGQLQALQRDYPWIAEIRGKGLMLGMEIAESPTRPLPDMAARITAACEAEGLLLLRCGIDGQTVRFLPPLVVTEAEISDAMARFSRALQKVAA